MWWEGGQRQTFAVFGLKDKVHIPKLSPPQRAAYTNFRIIPHSLSSFCHRPRQGCHCNGSRDAEEFHGSVSQTLNHRQCPGERSRREGKVNLCGNTWSMPCSREQLLLWEFLKLSVVHLRSHPAPQTVPGNSKRKMGTEEQQIIFQTDIRLYSPLSPPNWGSGKRLGKDFIPAVSSFHFSPPNKAEESLASHFSNQNTANPFRPNHGAFPVQAVPNKVSLTNEHKCK